ncbi:MAG: beta-ketoacyl-[acyl-carrier-protein] synthase family protein [Planctomycetia bacterium]|nr:beta-ketoacyl-[acyl-carrier-protein] synthase family protein [Planctomycetia bacterium]
MTSRDLKRRIAITGVGLVSPLGNTADALWEGLMSGRSGVLPLADLPHDDDGPTFAGQSLGFTGAIDDFGPLEKDQQKAIRKGLKLMCRECQMGVAVAQKALADAGITATTYPPERRGCVFGTDYMLTLPDDFAAGVARCMADGVHFDFSRWGTDGMSQVTPLWLLKYLPNMPASHVAIYNDLRGPNNSLTHREAAGNLAIGEAAFTISRGHADMIVTGATGTRIRPMNAIHALQQEEVARNGVHPAQASRPFDRDRTGMVLGEGAAAVVLESWDSAQSRGAKILGEVVGWSSSAVADRQGVADRRQALANVLRGALRSAGADPGQLGHIHAHGLATRSSDAAEASAIQDVCGPRDGQCPVTAAKSYFGNLGAGSGIVELISSVLALKHGQLFPVLNFQTPDAECPVRVARAGDKPGASFINLSVTPQGQASAVMVAATG